MHRFAQCQFRVIVFGMCGRFTAKNPNLIKKRFEEFDLHGPSMPARHNIGPAQLLLVIASGDKAEPPMIGNGATRPSSIIVEPTIKTMRWGLVAFWDKSENPKIAPINAKSEEVLTKRIFIQAVQKRRCLVPADGFYEWGKLGDKRKQPHHFQLKGGEAFFFAGIYESGGDGKPDTVAILTTSANELMREIHTRMPVILQGEHARTWLNGGPLTQEEVSRLSAPYPASDMEEWPVSDSVGNVRNEGPELVAPVPAGEIVAVRPTGTRLRLKSPSRRKSEESSDLLPGFDLNLE